MAKKTVDTTIQISAPNIARVKFRIIGTAPYVQNAMSQKARGTILDRQVQGSTRNKSRQKIQRDIDADYEGAKHISTEGWCGIPASAFRAAMISACRLVGFKMTIAKLSIFVTADGYDRIDGQPLVRIYGEPQMNQMTTRLPTGVFTIAIRPQWMEWYADVSLSFDADQFTVTDIFNLLNRVGMQVGIGEGRPDSKQSVGLGWGTFTIAEGLTDGQGA